MKSGQADLVLVADGDRHLSTGFAELHHVSCDLHVTSFKRTVAAVARGDGGKELPSGHFLQFANWKMAIETLIFSIDNSDLMGFHWDIPSG